MLHRPAIVCGEDTIRCSRLRLVTTALRRPYDAPFWTDWWNSSDTRCLRPRTTWTPPRCAECSPRGLRDWSRGSCWARDGCCLRPDCTKEFLDSPSSFRVQTPAWSSRLRTVLWFKHLSSSQRRGACEFHLSTYFYYYIELYLPWNGSNIKYKKCKTKCKTYSKQIGLSRRNCYYIYNFISQG